MAYNLKTSAEQLNFEFSILKEFSSLDIFSFRFEYVPCNSIFFVDRIPYTVL
jgi:hypothetical protein